MELLLALETTERGRLEGGMVVDLLLPLSGDTLHKMRSEGVSCARVCRYAIYRRIGVQTASKPLAASCTSFTGLAAPTKQRQLRKQQQ